MKRYAGYHRYRVDLGAGTGRFQRHDLHAIMIFFSEDCSFDFPRGPEFYGQRFIGKEQIRAALGGRFKGIPDVHYGEDRHWVAGDRGVS